MFRGILLIISAVIISGCSTPKPKQVVVKEFVYVEKESLNRPPVEKPSLKKDTPWTFSTDGKICTTKDGFKNLMDDINSIRDYTLKLDTELNTYKKYHDKKK